MAIDEDYVDIVNERISNYITRRMKDISENLEDEIGDAFVKKARNTLLHRATPDPDNSFSKSTIEEIAKNINVETDDNGEKQIVVEDDGEGLSVYLEYGTGLVGEQHKGTFTPASWQYAINRDKYKTLKLSSGEIKGFIFDYHNTNYIDKDDIVLDKSKKKSIGVFSQGLKPLRYIYDTRVSLNRTIRRQLNKNNGLSSLRKRLKEIANE